MGAPAWFSSLIAATNSSAPVYSTLSPTLPFVPRKSIRPTAAGRPAIPRHPVLRRQHGCRVLRHLKQSVVQRVLRQLAVKLVPRIYLLMMGNDGS